MILNGLKNDRNETKEALPATSSERNGMVKIFERIALTLVLAKCVKPPAGDHGRSSATALAEAEISTLVAVAVAIRKATVFITSAASVRRRRGRGCTISPELGGQFRQVTIGFYSQATL